MAQFLNRPLKVLDRIYRFVGQVTATDKLDLASPVQLVHDVSREADSFSGFMGDPNGNGFFTVESQVTAAGAGNNYGYLTLSPNAIAPGTFPQPIDTEQTDVFLWGFGFNTTAGIDDVQIWYGWSAANLPGGSHVYWEPLASWDQFKLVENTLYAGIKSGLTFGLQNFHLPRLFPWGGQIVMNATFTGAGDLYWAPIFQLVRKGGAPRGAA